MVDIKECACGKTYTRAQLDGLARGDDWKWPWGEVHELRHCTCGSTIHIVTESPDPNARESYRKMWATSRMLDEQPEEEPRPLEASSDSR